MAGNVIGEFIKITAETAAHVAIEYSTEVHSMTPMVEWRETKDFHEEYSVEVELFNRTKKKLTLVAGYEDQPQTIESLATGTWRTIWRSNGAGIEAKYNMEGVGSFALFWDNPPRWFVRWGDPNTTYKVIGAKNLLITPQIGTDEPGAKKIVITVDGVAEEKHYKHGDKIASGPSDDPFLKFENGVQFALYNGRLEVTKNMLPRLDHFWQIRRIGLDAFTSFTCSLWFENGLLVMHKADNSKAWSFPPGVSDLNVPPTGEIVFMNHEPWIKAILPGSDERFFYWDGNKSFAMG